MSDCKGCATEEAWVEARLNDTYTVNCVKFYQSHRASDTARTVSITWSGGNNNLDLTEVQTKSIHSYTKTHSFCLIFIHINDLKMN